MTRFWPSTEPIPFPTTSRYATCYATDAGISVCTAELILSYRKVSGMSFNLLIGKVRKLLMKNFYEKNNKIYFLRVERELESVESVKDRPTDTLTL